MVIEQSVPFELQGTASVDYVPAGPRDRPWREMINVPNRFKDIGIVPKPYAADMLCAALAA